MAFGVELAVVTGRENDRAVLDTALSLARRFRGHIEVLHPGLDPASAVPIGDPFGMAVPGLLGSLRQESEGLATAARQTFDSWQSESELRLSQGGSERQELSTSWLQARGEPGELVATWGRLADLIVVGTAAENDLPGTAMILEAALFRSGRPVMLASRPLRREAGRNIAILWDGGPQAARAVGDAMPLLSRAQSVAIFSSGEIKKGPDAFQLAGHLQWRGIETTARQVSGGRTETGDALAAEALDWGCDLLVMGAFGHSRMREFVLGGVTRFILQNARVPVLMAH